MNIGVICGSHRQNSQSERVGKYIQKELERATACKKAWLYTLAGNPLPLWSEDVWDKKHKWHAHLDKLSQQLRGADGFVIIAPEWNGMVPAALKNFFLLWHKQELAHKPAMLVAVSAGTGGAYPIAELRMSSYKNQFLCYMPDHIIIRHVGEESFEELSSAEISQPESTDPCIRKRIRYTLGMLCAYSEALQQVRNSGAWDPQRYTTGM
jgi:NAD(P)H-dependent FMN reductase